MYRKRKINAKISIDLGEAYGLGARNVRRMAQKMSRIPPAGRGDRGYSFTPG